MQPSQSIDRDDLIAIMLAATEHGCAQSTREKLLEVAQTTDAVAVGWFHCDGVGCPIRQAGRRANQTFQTAFDRIMASRFDVPWDPDRWPQAFEPFVVKVV